MLDGFYRDNRGKLVRYAAGIIAQRAGGKAGVQAAEDAVHEATAYYLARGEEWNEARYIGAIRFAAMRAGVVLTQVIETRNTAGEVPTNGARGRRTPSRNRRSRVTNFYPVQIFGRSLCDTSFGSEDLE
jgi:hypothetical protein